jgi:hypothetical protein
MSDSNLTTLADPMESERDSHALFARTHAAPAYRTLLDELYVRWERFNREYFDGQLRLPHLSLGPTSARRFSHCRLTTTYGGRLDITLSEAIAFGTNTRVVRQAWPAEGSARFLTDLLLGETVKQHVLEVRGETEGGYGGYGPLYAAEATRIGQQIGLPSVEPRRRGLRGAGLPVAAFWPWAFRPEGYYLGDIRLDGRLVAGMSPRPTRRLAVIPGAYEYFLYLVATGRTARLRNILEREVDSERERRSPALAAVERGPQSPDGKPLPVPEIDRVWVAWNGQCVAQIAAHILERRAWDGVPILADALEDAGCDNGLILDHCRLFVEHTSTCWVLKALTSAATPPGG